jgi:fructose-specific phosphotransferase system IIC component
MGLGSMELAVLLAIMAALGAFWGWMVYDCAVEEPSGTDKIVWILVILIGNFIGATIYYFARRRNRIAEKAPKYIDEKR